jgi:phosphoglycolate phosphatase-like HAD superfamily hydrolase
VTSKGTDFVPVAQRIAVFDNDGTLWCEQPFYVQGVFVFARVKALAAKHPEWKTKQPFAAVLADDHEAMARLGEKDHMVLLAATHAGMTTDEFALVARKWLDSATHPRFKRRYTECVYQPMLELLAYLRQNGFKNYIVTGGGVDFVRVFADKAYGIPPERVIGSSSKTRFEIRDGKPILVKLPQIHSINDGPGKPVNIHLHIGRRPILAAGNSDGDLEMLQYTAGGARPRLMMLVHHDDDKREHAYDRKSSVGRLDRALDEAVKRKWTVVSMKKEWRTIFPTRPKDRRAD